MSIANIFIIDTSLEYIEVFQFLCRDVLGFQVQAFTNITTATEKLMLNADYIFVDAQEYQRHESLFNKFKALPKNIIILGDLHPAQVTKALSVGKLKEIIKIQNLPNEEYCKINLHLLKMIGTLQAAAFIKVGEKMVAVTKEGYHFQQADVEKYQQKKLDTLYIQRERVDTLIEEYIRQLGALSAWGKIDEISIAKELSVNTEKIKNLAETMGWNNLIVDLTKQNLEKALHFSKMNPNFENTISHFRKIGAFTQSDHNSLSLMVALNLLEKTGRATEINKIILTLATLLHDISLKDEEYALKVQLKSELAKGGMRASDQVYTYFRHPENCATLCRQWRFAPPQTAEIILQHHERPDGSGFPNSLKAEQIDRSAAVFIISQDFADYFIENSGQPNYSLYVQEREKLYLAEPFLAPFLALKEMLKAWMLHYLTTTKTK